jgi:hypothetical protein
MKNNENGTISIDFSAEQLNTLVTLVFDYTRKLAEVNAVELNELNEPIAVSTNDTIISLQRYLKIQKRIFEKVA